MVVNKIEIGLFNKKDIKKLHVFFDEMDLEFDETKIKNFISNKDSYIFVAKADGDILGFAFGYLINRLDSKYPKFYVHSIYVGEEYQNKGVGTRIIDYVVGFANKNNCSSIFTIADKKNKVATSLCSHFEMKNTPGTKTVFSRKFNRG